MAPALPNSTVACPKLDAPIRNEVANVLGRQSDRAHLSVEQIGQEFERFGARAASGLVYAKRPRFILGQRGGKGVTRLVELLQLVIECCG